VTLAATAGSLSLAAATLVVAPGASLSLARDSQISSFSVGGTLSLASGATVTVGSLSTSAVPVFVGPGTLAVTGTSTLGGKWPTLRSNVTLLNEGTMTLPAGATCISSPTRRWTIAGTLILSQGTDLRDVDLAGNSSSTRVAPRSSRTVRRSTAQWPTTARSPTPREPHLRQRHGE
jgi:hypothetical protein